MGGLFVALPEAGVILMFASKPSMENFICFRRARSWLSRVNPDL
jgi:hypothetical protein